MDKTNEIPVWIIGIIGRHLVVLLSGYFGYLGMTASEQQSVTTAMAYGLISFCLFALTALHSIWAKLGIADKAERVLAKAIDDGSVIVARTKTEDRK